MTLTLNYLNGLSSQFILVLFILNLQKIRSHVATNVLAIFGFFSAVDILEVDDNRY
jgi:hypothetical protein